MEKGIMALLSKYGMRYIAAVILFLILFTGGVVISMDSTALAANKVTMVLEPDKHTYPRNSLPDFTVIIRNNSDKPVTICIYMIEYRLRMAMAAKGIAKGSFNYIYQPFNPMTWEAPTGKEFSSLSPGRQLSFRLELSQDAYFGFVQRHSQPPVIPSSHAIKGFPAGTYDFSTCIQDQMAIYKGKAGVFDHTLEEKQLKTLPRSEGAYFELIEASAKVTFQ